MRIFDDKTDFFRALGRPATGWMNIFSPMGQNAMGQNVEAIPVAVGSGWSDEAFHLRFIIPGVERKQFDLFARGGRLVLRGERSKPKSLKDSDDFDFALQYGPFERAMELPAGADVMRMQADFHHGVLDVRIPLHEEAKPRAVPISVDMGSTKGLARV